MYQIKILKLPQETSALGAAKSTYVITRGWLHCPQCSSSCIQIGKCLHWNETLGTPGANPSQGSPERLRTSLSPNWKTAPCLLQAAEWRWMCAMGFEWLGPQAVWFQASHFASLSFHPPPLVSLYGGHMLKGHRPNEALEAPHRLLSADDRWVLWLVSSLFPPLPSTEVCYSSMLFNIGHLLCSS